MLEAIVNPKSLKHGTWKMFFIGLLYSSLSFLLVRWFFFNDPVLVKYSGILVVTFCVMLSLPFMYYIIKDEEKKGETVRGIIDIFSVHRNAIFALMWLFVGFVVAFSFWYLVIDDTTLLNAQLETYCSINSPRNIEGCVVQYSRGSALELTSGAIDGSRFLRILENNVYVMIFTLILSLIFGAGAIFILAWNATVIASAVGIFAKYNLLNMPLGLFRYLLHGIPEIGGYFITALAGGILGAGIMKHGFKEKQFYITLENTIILLALALVVLFVAGIMEVYLTPLFF